MREFFIQVAMWSGTTALLAASSFLIILALEIASSRNGWRVRYRPILYALIYIPLGTLITAAMAVGGIRPLSYGAGTTALYIIAGLLLADFIYYWFHRLQHAAPALWRLHAVHHSIEEFGPLAGYHHISEAPLQVLFVGIPLSLFVVDPRVGLIGAIIALQGNYLHSTSRFHYGPVGRWIPDNRAHRIHHSIKPKHRDHNFGTTTLIWDRLFGTAYFPEKEWPPIGVNGFSEPRTMRSYFLATGEDASKNLSSRSYRQTYQRKSG